jgi:hypothetical protein
MAWNSHREADRSAKQSAAAEMEAADLRARPELSRDKATVGQHTLLQQKRLKNDAQSSTRRQSSS